MNDVHIHGGNVSFFYGGEALPGEVESVELEEFTDEGCEGEVAYLRSELDNATATIQDMRAQLSKLDSVAVDKFAELRGRKAIWNELVEIRGRQAAQAKDPKRDLKLFDTRQQWINAYCVAISKIDGGTPAQVHEVLEAELPWPVKLPDNLAAMVGSAGFADLSQFDKPAHVRRNVAEGDVSERKHRALSISEVLADPELRETVSVEEVEPDGTETPVDPEEFAALAAKANDSNDPLPGLE